MGSLIAYRVNFHRPPKGFRIKLKVSEINE